MGKNYKWRNHQPGYFETGHEAKIYAAVGTTGSWPDQYWWWNAHVTDAQSVGERRYKSPEAAQKAAEKWLEKHK